MQITITENGSREFYTEVVNITTQYRPLLAKPDRRLRNNVGSMRTSFILSIVAFLLFAFLGVTYGFDMLNSVMMSLMVITGAISIFSYVRLKKLVDQFLEDDRRSVVTLDEDGVEINKGDSQVVRLAWKTVAFVRAFKESVAFVSNDLTGLVLAVDKKYKDDILGYIRENNVDVTVIDA